MASVAAATMAAQTVSLQPEDQIRATMASGVVLSLSFKNPLSLRDRFKKGAEIFLRYQRRKSFKEWKTFTLAARREAEEAGENVGPNGNRGNKKRFDGLKEMRAAVKIAEMVAGAHLSTNHSAASAALQYHKQRAATLLPAKQQRGSARPGPSRSLTALSEGFQASHAAAVGASLTAASTIGLAELDAIASERQKKKESSERARGLKALRAHARGRDAFSASSPRLTTAASDKLLLAQASLLICGQGSDEATIEVLPRQGQRRASSAGVQPAIVSRLPLSRETRRTLQILSESLSEPYRSMLIDAMNGKTWFDWSGELQQQADKAEDDETNEERRRQQHDVDKQKGEDAKAGDSINDSLAPFIAPARPSFRSIAQKVRAGVALAKLASKKQKQQGSANSQASDAVELGAPGSAVRHKFSRAAPLASRSSSSAGTGSIRTRSEAVVSGALNSYPTGKIIHHSALLSPADSSSSAASFALSPDTPSNGDGDTVGALPQSQERYHHHHHHYHHGSTLVGGALGRKQSLVEMWRASHPHGVAATPASVSSPAAAGAPGNATSAAPYSSASSSAAGEANGGTGRFSRLRQSSAPLHRHLSGFAGAVTSPLSSSSSSSSSSSLRGNVFSPKDPNSISAAALAAGASTAGGGEISVSMPEKGNASSVLDPAALAELEKRGLPVDVAMSVLIAFKIIDGKLPARIASRPGGEVSVGGMGLASVGAQGANGGGSPPLGQGPHSRSRGNLFSPTSSTRSMGPGGGLRQNSSSFGSPPQAATGGSGSDASVPAPLAEPVLQAAPPGARFGTALPGLADALKTRLVGKPPTAPLEAVATTSPSGGAVLDPKDDPRFAEFFKQLKVGLPPPVVRRNMLAKADALKLTPDEIDFVVDGKPLPAGYSSPGAAAAANKPKPPPLPGSGSKDEASAPGESGHAKAASGDPKDDPRFAEFFKQLKVGLPPPVVRRNMLAKADALKLTPDEIDFVVDGKPLPAGYSSPGAAAAANKPKPPPLPGSGPKEDGADEFGEAPTRPAFLASIAGGVSGLKKASTTGGPRSAASKDKDAANAAAAPPKPAKRIHWKQLEPDAIKKGGFWSDMSLDTEGTNALIASVLGSTGADGFGGNGGIGGDDDVGDHGGDGDEGMLSESADYSGSSGFAADHSSALGSNTVAQAIAGGVFSDLASLFAPSANGSGPNIGGGTKGKSSGRSGSTQRGGGGRASIANAVHAKMEEQQKRATRVSSLSLADTLQHIAGESFSDNSSHGSDSEASLLEEGTEKAERGEEEDENDDYHGWESDRSDSWITVGSASSLSEYSETEETGLFSKLESRKAGNVWITLSRFSGVPFEAVEQALAALVTAKQQQEDGGQRQDREDAPPLRYPLLTEDTLRALLALKPTDEERKAFRDWLPSVLALSDLAKARVAKRDARRAEQRKRWLAREEAAARRAERATARAERKAAKKARRPRHVAAAEGLASPQSGVDDAGTEPLSAKADSPPNLSSARLSRNPTRTADGKRRRRVDSVEAELELMQQEEEDDMDAYAAAIGGEADVMLLRRPIPSLSADVLASCGADLTKLPKPTIVALGNRLAPPDAWIFRACASTRYMQRSDCLLLSMDLSPTVDLLKQKATSQAKACSELRLSPSFRHCLKIVWVTGNALNDPVFLSRSSTSSTVSVIGAATSSADAAVLAGASESAPSPVSATDNASSAGSSTSSSTPRVNISAAGFTLDSLAKLATVKSTDKTSSALSFVVETWLKFNNPNPIRAALMGTHAGLAPASSGGSSLGQTMRQTSLGSSSIAVAAPTSEAAGLADSQSGGKQQLAPGAIGPVVALSLASALTKECESLVAGSAVVMDALDQDLKGLKRVYKLALDDVAKTSEEIRKLEGGAHIVGLGDDERSHALDSLRRDKAAYEAFSAALGEKITECDAAMAELQSQYRQVADFYSLELGGPGGKANGGPYTTNAPEILLKDMLSFFKEVAKAEGEIIDRWTKAAKKIAIHKLEREKQKEKEKQKEQERAREHERQKAQEPQLSSPSVGTPASPAAAKRSSSAEVGGNARDDALSVADLDPAPTAAPRTAEFLPTSPSPGVRSGQEGEDMREAEFQRTSSGALTAIKRQADEDRGLLADAGTLRAALPVAPVVRASFSAARPPPVPPPKTAAKLAVDASGRMSIVAGPGDLTTASARQLDFSGETNAPAPSSTKPPFVPALPPLAPVAALMSEAASASMPRRPSRSETGPTRRLISSRASSVERGEEREDAPPFFPEPSPTPALIGDDDDSPLCSPLASEKLVQQVAAAAAAGGVVVDSSVLTTSPRKGKKKKNKKRR